jgi:hypothetical protein
LELAHFREAEKEKVKPEVKAVCRGIGKYY